VQFLVDGSKSGARIANGAAAICQPPKSGYSPSLALVLRYARRPRPARSGRRRRHRAIRPLVDDLPPQVYCSSLRFTGPLPIASADPCPARFCTSPDVDATAFTEFLVPHERSRRICALLRRRRVLRELPHLGRHSGASRDARGPSANGSSGDLPRPLPAGGTPLHP
jgi:hypothetical protein